MSTHQEPNTTTKISGNGQPQSGNTMFEQFTRQYSLNKTLRFELRPVGETLEHIKNKGLLSQDEERAQKYKQAKKIIDEYHKDFIEKSLRTVQLNGLERYEELYRKKERNESDNKEFEKLKANLRKQIALSFEGKKEKQVINKEINQKFQRLFKKELIKDDLESFITSNYSSIADNLKKVGINDCKEALNLVQAFKEFTTYFTGFHKNRKNIYSADKISTAITYRLIHENLPKFLDNIIIYEKVKKAGIDLSDFYNEMKDVLQRETLDEIFSLNYFNHILNQSGIDRFNCILSGKSENNQVKIKGLNEYINEYNQKQLDKKNRIPKLKPLYKQILSDRVARSFIPEKYSNDNELLESIENFYKNELLYRETEEGRKNILMEIKSFLKTLSDYNLKEVYLVNDTSLTNISQQIFGSWDYIKKAMAYYYELTNQASYKQKSQKKYQNAKEKWLKRKQFSIAQIEDALAEYKNIETNPENLAIYNTTHPVCDYFKKCGYDEEKRSDIFGRITSAYNAVKDLLNTQFPENEHLAQQKDKTILIKHFLDALMELLHFIRPFKPKEEVAMKDEAFYGKYEALYDALNLVTHLYNKVRNHLSKKPYSTEKFKLNFDKSILLDGWDAKEEERKLGMIFRKNGLYYLGIMNNKYNKIFKDIPVAKSGEPYYEKMVYKQIADAARDLPNLIQIDGKVVMKKGRKNEQGVNEERENYLNTYLPDEVNTIRKNKSYLKTSETFRKQDSITYIKYYQNLIREYFSFFDFTFKRPEEYSDWVEFTKHVSSQGYSIQFQDVPASYIHQHVKNGKLYIFQIYSKDFSPHSKGNSNLHTLYWKALFEERNLQDGVFKLNGQAEVFYRKKSIEEKDAVVHRANQPIDNKNSLAEKKQSSFEYDIIKDKRFTVDKFLFHVPITLNFKAEGVTNLNEKVNHYLKKHSDNTHVIGIDRGERHLLYLSVINSQGDIVEQYSLNEICNEYKGKTYRTDYHSLLDKKEKEREEARRDWGTIETIKELKEGYLSQVVHQIAKMMVKYNAIVVMENLNSGFKRGRQKVEKQVYQKFEKMLIDKLNFLAFKNPEAHEPSIYNALQLANKFESFKKMGKQNGFIFYVPASYTSNIDPATGFVDFLKPRYESVEKAQAFFDKFKSIQFNPEKIWFEFDFDYSEFTEKAEGSITQWKVCTTNKTRYAWDKTMNNNKGGQREYNITKCLKDLFLKENIDYSSGKDIKQQIIKQNKADFFKALIKYLNITLTLRHNNGKSGAQEQDYILSPVEPFFDSRNAGNQMPNNADANGAYHIALKGLWVLKQIREAKDLKKPKLAISNKEWFAFAQQMSAQRNIQNQESH